MARKPQKENSNRLSIGQVVDRLKKSFPNLSISKIRFLEDEGLISPKRTQCRYRLFSEEDIGKLSEILRLQRDDFLPLVVIKERLKGWVFDPNHKDSDASDKKESKKGAKAKPITLAKLMKETNTSEAAIKVLRNFSLLNTDEGISELSTEEAEIIKIFSKLNKYGIEARHLRMYENLAQRETLIFQQILTPQIQHKSQKTRHKGLGELLELTGLVEKMHSIVLRKSLKEANLLK